MLVTTSALTVLHRAPYSTEQDHDPLKWGEYHGEYAGNFIEKIMCLDPATNTVLDNFTLAPHINGEVLAGMVLHLDCEVVSEKLGKATKYKWRVVGARPASVAAADVA